MRSKKEKKKSSEKKNVSNKMMLRMETFAKAIVNARHCENEHFHAEQR